MFFWWFVFVNETKLLLFFFFKGLKLLELRPSFQALGLLKKAFG